jgi:hypothetical protein
MDKIAESVRTITNLRELCLETFFGVGASVRRWESFNSES